MTVSTISRRMDPRVAFAFVVWTHCLGAAEVLDTPPLYNITAKSLYEAGLKHGQLARERIRRHLELSEMLALWNFSRAEGKTAYEALRRQSTLAYPQYAEEFRGIAEGAEVDLDRLWAANLVIELENLMDNARAENHCSDIFAIAPGGYREGFAIGHNEDWSAEVAANIYYVKYTAAPGADFESCAGLLYPGALTGWAVAWNSYGMFWSVNTLVPKQIRVRGITTAFIQKDAICGRGRGQDLESVIEGLNAPSFPSWADGASINIASLREQRMVNVETWENISDVVEVTEEMGNYSHFNMYKHLQQGVLDAPQASTLARQSRSDALAAPRSTEDIVNILSDASNKEFPIFRNTTMVSHVLDGRTGILQIWCCQDMPASNAPTHTWNLFHFWEKRESNGWNDHLHI